MSTTDDDQQVALVKVESGSESINDIQNYLETFNKEIEGGNPDGTRESNTLYVDANGRYYYTQPVMCVASSEEEGASVASGTSLVSAAVAGDTAGQVSSSTTQTMTLTGEAGAQMLINSGDNSFGTVTLLPHDNGTFVVFVQAPDADKTDGEGEQLLAEEEGEDQDLTVYDFEEDGGQAEHAGNESEVEDEKPKIVKVVQKKNLQNVTTAHMCNYCNYTSPKRYLLSRHMKSHSEERPHKCSVCERGFKTLASLQNHVNTHTGTKPHQCRFCNSSFTTSGELVRHIRYKHTFEKPHRCTLCDYSSVELSKLRNHIRCHTGERPYQCPHCTYASPDTFKLKRHLRIHTGEKPYECEICHARFTQSNSLKAHRLIHSTADKPIFRCELCPATCGRKTDLRIHVQKLHTSDRPLKCKRCGKSFPDRYSYKVHNKTHEGEKCYRCDLCPYASISARHLESHMLIHTDQKPYQCEMCDQAFRQKQLLKRHQNLYHTPDYIPPPPKEKTHECPECGRAFRHKGNLIRHMAVHDPNPSSQESALALKLGRQKKVQFIDGQQVELLEDDDELEEETGVVVNDASGQQFVVLEVIQMTDENEEGEVKETQQYLVTSQDELLEGGVTLTSETERKKGKEMREAKPLIKIERRLQKIEGVDDCFGFVDGDEDVVEEDDVDTSRKITVVTS